SENELILLTVLMMIVTIIPRVFPFWFLGKRTLPEAFTIWLSYVPAAVLAAMLGPELFLRNNHIYFSSSNTYLCMAIPTLIVGYLTKNIFLTVITGMGGLGLYRLWG